MAKRNTTPTPDAFEYYCRMVEAENEYLSTVYARQHRAMLELTDKDIAKLEHAAQAAMDRYTRARMLFERANAQ